MAYNAAITYSRKRIKGRQHVVVTVIETEVTLATHEFSFASPDSGVGTLTFHHCTLATGGAGITATTVDPQVGEATGASSVFINGAAAADTRNAPDSRFYVSGGLLYGRSGSDGNIGSTGTVTTVIVCSEGHV